MAEPLILITNDDGIQSEGLWSAAEALLPLGEVLVVAPDRQWSGAGRSMPSSVSGRLTSADRVIQERLVQAYAVDATPAKAVLHGVLELAPRRPDLVVSGINLGENISTEITISGTVGAALEAAACDIPAMAVSLALPLALHLDTTGVGTDYSAAQAFTYQFARFILEVGLPYDADVLNVNVPRDATRATAWRLTRLSRRRYYMATPPDRESGDGRLGYRQMDDPSQAQPDSDVHVLKVDNLVSVTPLSLDMTARTDFGALDEALRRSPVERPPAWET
jgi:5'-nucleotidase